MRAKAGEIRFLYGGTTKAKDFLKDRTEIDIPWIDKKDTQKLSKADQSQLKKNEDILSDAGINHIE